MLRPALSHRPERWNEFRRRYEKELDENFEALAPIVAASRKHTVTLLYSARDTQRNAAVVLRDYLIVHEHGRKANEP